MNKHPNYDDCLNEDDCSYQEPHTHGFACDKQCPCRKGEHETEMLPLSRVQRFKNIIWRWRVSRAFDARDQHEAGSPGWLEADRNVRRLFGA